jgi:serine/threonine protein kinase
MKRSVAPKSGVNRWVINSTLGRGSFGTVYMATQPSTGLTIALKIGSQEAAEGDVAAEERIGTVAYENRIYRELWQVCPQYGLNVPKLYTVRLEDLTGIELPGISPSGLLGLELLGNSLSYYFRYRCHGLFSVKTVCLVGIQCLDLIKNTHSCGYVHRDIKPDNFLLGRGPRARTLYLIDFGLAKKFKHDRVHISPEEHHKLIGTARYCSLNCHAGLEMSRRDDLEALSYMLLYFRLGQLPWQNLATDTKNPIPAAERYALIGQTKRALSAAQLCQSLPEPERSAFTEFITYCRGLSFAERPNYRYLRETLKGLLVKLQLEIDKYDWEA